MARLDYTYEGRPVGSAYVKTEQTVLPEEPAETEEPDETETSGQAAQALCQKGCSLEAVLQPPLLLSGFLYGFVPFS